MFCLIEFSVCGYKPATYVVRRREVVGVLMLSRQICVCAFRLIFTRPRLEIVAHYFSRLYFLHLSRFQSRQRRRRRTHESSENVKCKSPKASCSGTRRAGRGHGKQKHVEAVTLFEVITMGRSAMQVTSYTLCRFVEFKKGSVVISATCQSC